MSGGWLAGCALVCPYHGWEYGPEGTATRIPQLGDGVPIPPGARLATVRTAVRHGWVWACLAPEGAEVLPVPEVPEHGARGLAGRARARERLGVPGHHAHRAPAGAGRVAG
jgi:phenylpropionate dioxygenase-like ring-hydroxylating dioxygenase large terminal subunit